jgi:hypothetical protein
MRHGGRLFQNWKAEPRLRQARSSTAVCKSLVRLSCGHTPSVERVRGRAPARWLGLTKVRRQSYWRQRYRFCIRAAVHDDARRCSFVDTMPSSLCSAPPWMDWSRPCTTPACSSVLRISDLCVAPAAVFPFSGEVFFFFGSGRSMENVCHTSLEGKRSREAVFLFYFHGEKEQSCVVAEMTVGFQRNGWVARMVAPRCRRQAAS